MSDAVAARVTQLDTSLTAPRLLRWKYSWLQSWALLSCSSVGILVALVAYELAVGHATGVRHFYGLIIDGRLRGGLAPPPFGTEPLGSLLVVTFLACPPMMAVQFRSIDALVPAMIENGSVAAAGYEAGEELTAIVRRTNRSFSRLGSRGAFLICALVACGTSVAMVEFFVRQGLYEGQLRRTLGSGPGATATSHALFDSWWAGPHNPIGAACLILLACVFFYFLAKELVVGVIFFRFIIEISRARIFFSPNLSYNIDGYHGMRSLRSFIRITYLITLLELVAFFSIFFVFGTPNYVLYGIAVVVVMGPFFAVVIPTVMVQQHIIESKKRYVRVLAESQNAKPNGTVDVWAWGNLPFSVTRVVSAGAVYLIAPCLLILFAALTKGGL